MERKNKKPNIAFAMLLGMMIFMALAPFVLADDLNASVTVTTPAPTPVLPFTARVLISSSLGIPVIFILLRVFNAKNYREVFELLILALVGVGFVAGIVAILGL